MPKTKTTDEFHPKFSERELTRSAYARRHGIDNTPPPKVRERLVLLSHFLGTVRTALNKVSVKISARGEVRLPVTSGFRGKELNRAIGGALHSDHRRGDAADIVPKGLKVLDAFCAILGLNISYRQCIYEVKHYFTTLPSGKLKRQKAVEWIHIAQENGKATKSPTLWIRFIYVDGQRIEKRSGKVLMTDSIGGWSMLRDAVSANTAKLAAEAKVGK